MNLRALLLGLTFAVIWSSAFSAARVIVADAPPLTALVFRFLLSGLLGVGIARALGQSWRLDPRRWRAVMIFGICQNALYLGLNFVAMQTVQASLAAIIGSTMPLLVAAANWIFFRERLPALGIGGLIAGFAGVAIIMGQRISAGADGGAILLCVIGAFALAFATLTVRNASGSGNLLMVVGLQLLVGSAALAVPAALLESWTVNWSWSLVAAFSYTTLVPGLAATLLWFMLVGQIGPTRAATFHFLNPFFGVAIAAVLLGEALGAADVLGVAVIMAGILAVQRARVLPAKAEA